MSIEIDYDHVQGDFPGEERESSIEWGPCIECGNEFPPEELTYNQDYQITVCAKCNGLLLEAVRQELLPYEGDTLVKRVASRLGLLAQSRQSIEITDLKAIKDAGLMKQTPDYAAIRKLMDEGVYVAGATAGRYEYVLRAPAAAEPKEAA